MADTQPADTTVCLTLTVTLTQVPIASGSHWSPITSSHTHLSPSHLSFKTYECVLISESLITNMPTDCCKVWQQQFTHFKSTTLQKSGFLMSFVVVVVVTILTVFIMVYYGLLLE